MNEIINILNVVLPFLVSVLALIKVLCEIIKLVLEIKAQKKKKGDTNLITDEFIITKSETYSVKHIHTSSMNK